jgi:hypothetical protein
MRTILTWKGDFPCERSLRGYVLTATMLDGEQFSKLTVYKIVEPSQSYVRFV